MNKTVGFIGGITAGMVIGAAVTMMFDPVTDKERCKLRKKTQGVFRSIGGVIDTALDIIN